MFQYSKSLSILLIVGSRRFTESHKFVFIYHNGWTYKAKAPRTILVLTSYRARVPQAECGPLAAMMEKQILSFTFKTAGENIL
jgi:hypothetical protein